jgi:hypothetical protein
VGAASTGVSGGWDQSMSSFLYDPPFVLAGVGQNTSQTGPPGEAVFHLAYTVIEALSRCVFAWTDSRGETLDVAVVPLSSVASSGGRPRMFARMWMRGQRWWVAYADQTCVTIAKVGRAMGVDEKEDWESVVHKFISSTNARAEFPDDRIESRLRFPSERRARVVPAAPEAVDIVKDAATPATPASMPVTILNGPAPAPTAGGSLKATRESLVDTAATTLRSVTILAVTEAATPDLFTCEATDEVLVVSDKEGDCEAKAVLVIDVAPDRPTRQVELSMLSHFGLCGTQDRPTCDWDAADATSSLGHIAANFHALRAVASPPCWPARAWRSPYPLHVDAVWNLRSLLCSFAHKAVRK